MHQGPIAMIEKWCEGVDKGSDSEVVLSDLLKAFDCLPHELLIAEPHAYGFDMKSLRPIHNYRPNRKQRGKVGGTYSSWRELLYGGSIEINSWAIAIH